MVVRGVSLSAAVSVLNEALIEPNEKRIKRFFRAVSLDRHTFSISRPKAHMGSSVLSYGMDVFIPQTSPAQPSAPAHLQSTIQQVSAGYPFTAFEGLAQDLGVTQRELAETLGISSSTLSRRRGGKLSAAESSRVYEIRRLLKHAEQSIGHPADARRWLREPNPNLGERPLTLARTAPGLEAVERYLTQIAEGVLL